MGMTFLHPEFIYLMLPLVLILFFFLLTQREEVESFFSAEVMRRLRVHTNMMTLRARNALFLVMFVFIILALAQPVIEEGKVKVQAKSADIMIALDISDSMLAEDVYPSRLEQAKQKILDLLELSPQERLGVMAFAKDAYLVAPLSFDHRAVHFLVKQLQPSFITEKGTDFEKLLFSAGEMMKENEEKYLLILSDGGDQESFSEEIEYAKETGIKVFVLGIGTEKGAPIKRKDGTFLKMDGNIIVSHLNTEIAELATQSGGSYIESVTSSKDIEAMLGEISGKSNKRSLKEEEITQYIPLFYYPLAVAMILLLIATSSMTRRRKVEVPSAFIAGWLLLSGAPSEADLMDFRVLDEAKAAYAAGDYNRSAELYSDYAFRHRTPESYYDQANAVYKSGNYASAAKLYEKVHFADKEKQFDTLHNLGNAYAKQGQLEMLKKAVESYEKALEIKEEQPTRENLERVKELIKEQEQQQEQQQDSSGEQESDEQQDKQEQEQQKDQKSKDQQDSDAKKKDQEPEEQESGEKSEEPQSKKSDKPSDKKQEEASKQGKDQEQKQSAEEEERQKKSAKPEEEQPEQTAEEAAAVPEAQEQPMSDLEAQKWLKMLSKQPASHIYRLSPAQEQEREEKSNEKPW